MSNDENRNKKNVTTATVAFFILLLLHWSTLSREKGICQERVGLRQNQRIVLLVTTTVMIVIFDHIADLTPKWNSVDLCAFFDGWRGAVVEWGGHPAPHLLPPWCIWMILLRPCPLPPVVFSQSFPRPVRPTRFIGLRGWVPSYEVLTALSSLLLCTFGSLWYGLVSDWLISPVESGLIMVTYIPTGSALVVVWERLPMTLFPSLSVLLHVARV